MKIGVNNLLKLKVEIYVAKVVNRNEIVIIINLGIEMMV